MDRLVRLGLIVVGFGGVAVAAASGRGSSGETGSDVLATDGGPDGTATSGDGSSATGTEASDGGGGVREGGVDGGISRDAAPGGTQTTLNCGSASCNIPAESCCVTSASGGFAFACEATCRRSQRDSAALKCRPLVGNRAIAPASCGRRWEARSVIEHVLAITEGGAERVVPRLTVEA